MKDESEKRVWLIQLLNDRSGSARVLRNVAECLLSNNYRVSICTSNNDAIGFLHNVPGAQYHYFRYTWSGIKLITLLRYMFTQFVLFFTILAKCKREDIIYCNTLLPAGAAIAGKLKGATVCYHLHELAINPPLLDKILKGVVRHTAAKVIFVSPFLAHHFAGLFKHTVIVNNGLSTDFEACLAQGYIPPANQKFTVTMACSLKSYKGVEEFAVLAALLPGIQFNMVTSAGSQEVALYKERHGKLTNLSIIEKATNMVEIYLQSSLVLNLSKEEEVVETFGLSLLEAMACGRPVIAPPVGGPTDFIQDGVEGYLIPASDVASLAEAIRRLKEEPGTYIQLAHLAQIKAGNYRPGRFSGELQQVIEAL